jgi:hypothetical protein
METKNEIKVFVIRRSVLERLSLLERLVAKCAIENGYWKLIEDES